jgi:hypothetical protein
MNDGVVCHGVGCLGPPLLSVLRVLMAACHVGVEPDPGSRHETNWTIQGLIESN